MIQNDMKNHGLRKFGIRRNHNIRNNNDEILYCTDILHYFQGKRISKEEANNLLDEYYFDIHNNSIFKLNSVYWRCDICGKRIDENKKMSCEKCVIKQDFGTDWDAHDKCYNDEKNMIKLLLDMQNDHQSGLNFVPIDIIRHLYTFIYAQNWNSSSDGMWMHILGENRHVCSYFDNLGSKWDSTNRIPLPNNQTLFTIFDWHSRESIYYLAESDVLSFDWTDLKLTFQESEQQDLIFFLRPEFGIGHFVNNATQHEWYKQIDENLSYYLVSSLIVEKEEFISSNLACYDSKKYMDIINIFVPLQNKSDIETDNYILENLNLNFQDYIDGLQIVCGVVSKLY